VTILLRSRWKVNGSKSNQVTVYVDNSAPGIYTLTENGIGAGAILHSDYTAGNDSSPAVARRDGPPVHEWSWNRNPAGGRWRGCSGSPLSVSDEAADIFVLLDDGTDLPAQATSRSPVWRPDLPGYIRSISRCRRAVCERRCLHCF
jgi:hypothetical protein